MTRSIRIGFALGVLALASTVAATDVSYWTHAKRDDYEGARLRNLDVTN